MHNPFLVQEIVDYDLLFSQGNSKINKRIKLSPEDKKAGVKIFCKETYAQDLYDNLYSGMTKPANKDFTQGMICKVKAKSVNFSTKMIEAQDIDSLSSIYIPFREFTEDPSLLAHHQVDSTFKVVIYKSDNGDFLGSERKCAALTYRDDLDEFSKTNKWFYVKVVSLVRGGYLALYKGTVKCFLPGSHAAANVIRDFNEYINKEIPVMIENYDATNDLFIVSYKKYIKQTLPQRVHELKFGEKYSGILTNKPYDFGMFVEFQNYFTGLLHKTEFENYDKVMKEFKSGDQIDFYIKEITIKKGEPRIILTTDVNNVNPDSITWQSIKDRIEGHELDYEFDKSSFTITVTFPDSNQTFTTDVNHLKGRIKIQDTGRIKVEKVDTIKRQIRYDFFS
jgi:ribosomal protein S1